MPASSSMSRIFGWDFICIFLQAREDNAKGSTAINLGLILERAAVFFNNASRDRQAQPGTGLFGGKERVEETLLNLQGNTLAGVNHFQNGHRRGVTRQMHQGASRTQCNRAVP